jgi:hypothetical protein
LAEVTNMVCNQDLISPLEVPDVYVLIVFENPNVGDPGSIGRPTRDRVYAWIIREFRPVASIRVHDLDFEVPVLTTHESDLR